MIKVSEKTNADLNDNVTIIEKKYTEFDAKTLGTYATDESKFKTGLLILKMKDPGGYAGITNYEVRLDDGHIINFNSNNQEYLFKVEKGGMKTKKTKKTKKTNKTKKTKKTKKYKKAKKSKK